MKEDVYLHSRSRGSALRFLLRMTFSGGKDMVKIDVYIIFGRIKIYSREGFRIAKLCRLCVELWLNTAIHTCTSVSPSFSWISTQHSSTGIGNLEGRKSRRRESVAKPTECADERTKSLEAS